MNGKEIFISHATADDFFVKQLRETLENLGLPVWWTPGTCGAATSWTSKSKMP